MRARLIVIHISIFFLGYSTAFFTRMLNVKSQQHNHTFKIGFDLHGSKIGAANGPASEQQNQFMRAGAAPSFFNCLDEIELYFAHLDCSYTITNNESLPVPNLVVVCWHPLTSSVSNSYIAVYTSKQRRKASPIYALQEIRNVMGFKNIVTLTENGIVDIEEN
jgi:hypothetical protein